MRADFKEEDERGPGSISLEQPLMSDVGSHLLLSERSNLLVNKVKDYVEKFYQDHTEIKASHGIQHVRKVHHHAVQAIASIDMDSRPRERMEIEIAALLHDVDDSKYFPHHTEFENARSILQAAQVDAESCTRILKMIGLVSVSKNGNHVPDSVKESGDYHLLIPHWADRLEAVGAIGVVHCYQYNMEHDLSLSSPKAPRAVTEAQVREHATPNRFEAYLASGGKSDDMISHCYDKLLHIVRPSKEIVRNSYLENMARESSKELVEMCIRFGKTGIVDVDYVQEIARKLDIDL